MAASSTPSGDTLVRQEAVTSAANWTVTLEGDRLTLRGATPAKTRTFARIDLDRLRKLYAGIQVTSWQPKDHWRCFLANATARDKAFAPLQANRSYSPARLPRPLSHARDLYRRDEIGDRDTGDRRDQRRAPQASAGRAGRDDGDAFRRRAAAAVGRGPQPPQRGAGLYQPVTPARCSPPIRRPRPRRKRAKADAAAAEAAKLDTIAKSAAAAAADAQSKAKAAATALAQARDASSAQADVAKKAADALRTAEAEATARQGTAMAALAALEAAQRAAAEQQRKIDALQS